MADPFVGQIQLFSFPYAPSGWAPCEGQVLSIAQNQALYSLIGTTYGGNGTTTFALPDLKGKAPDPGMNYYIALEGIFPPRS